MLQFTYPGPTLNACYHNHSSWSDGGTDLKETCRAAKKTGLKEFGLSDHWVVSPYEEMKIVEWSLRLDRLDEYVETLLKMRKELEDETFSLKIGLEVDFFYENADSVLANLEKYPIDYLIGSVHYSDLFPICSPSTTVLTHGALSQLKKKRIFAKFTGINWKVPPHGKNFPLSVTWTSRKNSVSSTMTNTSPMQSVCWISFRKQVSALN